MVYVDYHTTRAGKGDTYIIRYDRETAPEAVRRLWRWRLNPQLDFGQQGFVAMGMAINNRLRLARSKTCG